MVLAWALGVSTLGDAYNTANTAPNMLFALVAGGVLSSALVPMLVRHQDDVARAEDASVVLGTVTALSLVLSVVMALAAPWLMEVLAAGSGARAGHDELMVLGITWMRMSALQITCYAISVVAMGVLTARRRLAVGAAAGILTNVVTVVAAVLFVAQVGGRHHPLGDVSGNAVAVLGWGTTLGVAAMAAVQLHAARQALPGLQFRPRLRHPAMRELLQLGRWVLVYVAVNQVGLAIVVAMASSVAGGVSAYQWAFMVMQLPYAIIAVSLFSSAYPAIASAAAQGGDLTAVVARPARVAVDLLLPAAAGLALLASPIAVVVVGPDGADLVAAALAGFAVSLVPFSVFQLLTRASYARRDARTPAIVNVAANAAMVGVDGVVLALPLGASATVAGLALGHAGSYVVACALLYRSLWRVGALRRPSAASWANLRLPVLGSLAMSVVVAMLPTPSTGARVWISAWLVAAAVSGAVVYAGAFAVAMPLIRTNRAGNRG